MSNNKTTALSSGLRITLADAWSHYKRVYVLPSDRRYLYIKIFDEILENQQEKSIVHFRQEDGPSLRTQLTVHFSKLDVAFCMQLLIDVIDFARHEYGLGKPLRHWSPSKRIKQRTTEPAKKLQPLKVVPIRDDIVLERDPSIPRPEIRQPKPYVPPVPKETFKQKHPTLREVFLEYRACRRLRPATLNSYETIVGSTLNVWMDRPIDSITQKDVEELHKFISSRAPSTANQTMRLFSALVNFAHIKFEIQSLKCNPVKILSALQLWNPHTVRTSTIKTSQFPKFFSALRNHSNRAEADYQELLLFTGFRRSEGQNILWEDIDFEDRTLTVRETKNHDDHTLPMSEHLFRLLSRRRKERPADAYVFENSRSQKPLEAITTISETMRCAFGHDYTLHDLRRTFATVAHRLKIDAKIISRLMNHRPNGSGGAVMTARYIIIDIDDLREPMEQISKRLLELSGISNECDSLGFDIQSERLDLPAISTEVSDADRLLLSCIAAGVATSTIAKICNTNSKSIAMQTRRLAVKLLGPQNLSGFHIPSVIAITAIRRGLININQVYDIARTDGIDLEPDRQFQFPIIPEEKIIPTITEQDQKPTIATLIADLYRRGSIDQVQSYAHLLHELASDDSTRSSAAYRALLSMQ